MDYNSTSSSNSTSIDTVVEVVGKRYLLVARPLCLGHRHAVRGSALISLAVWAAPLAVLCLAFYGYFFWFSVCLLLPFPLFVFFCLDTCRVFSCSSSVPGEEKRRVLGTLAFILGNYSVLFLPFIVNILLKSLSISAERYHLETIGSLLLYLSPVVDPLLYICMKKNSTDFLRAFPCCRGLVCHTEETGTVPTVSETITTV
ncbi:hypothetical protein AAFF_G00135670 [Aldrovandia affinis]|uniref:G-protein coupled receptors family 1 profile domain-containing protein n=1 Tax=Aldrovandia affinis TaxID=143900 RepID=A0AAD7W8S8_9TELE|nr:hypothetical protein AAFF_G00135670 [Aldrovandia affinis]